jgi:hypothetical protein
MIGINVISPNEYPCLENLEQYKILNTKPEPVFDKLVATAAKMLNVSLAMINFVGSYKVWGLSEQSVSSDMITDQANNICSIAIQKDSLVKFETITKNPGLILNPMTLGEHGLQFFASAAITTKGGLNVGAVCIVDSQYRDFNSTEQKKLDWIASMVTAEMDKRLAVHAVA